MIDLTSFINHVAEEHLIAEGQRVLLAVSGGRDSVTLLDLMCRSGFSVGVAHCNFHLRPGDCDRDEAFVRQLASERSIDCHVAQFETEAFAVENGLSVEAAARELRYRFFDEIRIAEGYDLVATAHHRDDAIETFFINLLRGAGIGGLHGMPLRNGTVVRPLLCYCRDEIDAYIAERGLSYVDDYTNSQTLYLRNRIRLQLIPLLREISPSFDSVMDRNLHNLADADSIYRSAIEQLRERLTEKVGERTLIDIGRLCEQEQVETILFELLRPFGFNSDIVAQIARSLHAQSGKQFFSPTHCLVKDRERLIVTPFEDGSDKQYLVYEDSVIKCITSRKESCTDAESVGLLEMSVTAYHGEQLRLSKNEACFDRRGLQFPLLLRHWREGDRFRPFGMKGTRLVSDLFSDLKLSVDEKRRVWLLCNGDEVGTILWVVGYRAAHFAVVGDGTSEVVMVKML